MDHFHNDEADRQQTQDARHCIDRFLVLVEFDLLIFEHEFLPFLTSSLPLEFVELDHEVVDVVVG